MPQRRIETTHAVYRTILDAYNGKLGVYSSFSNPDGMAFGGGGQQGEMHTVWGFRDMDCKILEARSTWDIEWVVKMGQFVDNRINEKHQYWLFVHEQESDDEVQD
jgi:hypothetical protein